MYISASGGGKVSQPQRNFSCCPCAVGSPSFPEYGHGALVTRVGFCAVCHTLVVSFEGYGEGKILAGFLVVLLFGYVCYARRTLAKNSLT